MVRTLEAEIVALKKELAMHNTVVSNCFADFVLRQIINARAVQYCAQTNLTQIFVFNLGISHSSNLSISVSLIEIFMQRLFE
jgi:hypothetical protein